MKRAILLPILLILGCATQHQLDALRGDADHAERVYAATTQATADARQAATALPAGSAAAREAARAIGGPERVEQTARVALDLARAALARAVSQAVSAIPSPWTPVLASLIPAAIPLIFSIVQSHKLGRAHQTVQHVTRELEEHKAALAAVRSNAGVPAGG